MKTLVVGVAAALFFMANNAAADGPYRRPAPTIAAPVAAPPTWTGFYLGAGIGAGAVVNDVTVHDRVSNERLFDFSGGDDGVLGTVIVGWDWQLDRILCSACSPTTTSWTARAVTGYSMTSTTRTITTMYGRWARGLAGCRARLCSGI